MAIDIQSKDMLNPAQSILNMNKYRNLWKVLAGIRASQTTSPLLTPDLDRMRVLRVGAKDGQGRVGGGRAGGWLRGDVRSGVLQPSLHVICHCCAAVKS